MAWRLSDDPVSAEEEEKFKDPEVRKNHRCKIFFSFTSNMVSCGNREVIRYIAQHGLVDVMTTTAGAIEEDLMKCMAPTFHGDFALKGSCLLYTSPSPRDS